MSSTQIVQKFRELSARHDLCCQSEELPDGLEEIYLYSHDMKYRYAFARWWDPAGSLDLWVGLNPAKGDTEKRRRPTLDRCIVRSRLAGAGGLIFANLFAVRHNKPSSLRSTADPVGLHNDAVLRELSLLAGQTYVAWGAQGDMLSRAAEVLPLLHEPRCLGVTASGQPRHPLYVRGDVADRPWP
jgi:hypothetical protein